MIAYRYSSEGWRQEEFLARGGWTVVFLNYNKAATIRESVAGALAQTCPPCEMFFMDDASTDGSGETMEELVRAYRGPHKVTVVRNETNRRITGQWNQVAKLASGNWFGMFCADDVAMADRVAQAMETARETPTLKGFCTSGYELNSVDGTSDRPIATGYADNEATGRTAPFEIAHGGTAVVGATAFWHRSLFENELTDAPLDDILLRWVLQWRMRGSDDVVWRWDTTRRTIRYAIGEGLSSAGRERILPDDPPSVVWTKKARMARRFASVMAKSWAGVAAYYRRNGADARWRAFANCEWLLQRVLASGTWGRLALLPQVFAALVSRADARERKLLAAAFAKRLLVELFGLRMAGALRGGRCSGRVEVSNV